MDLLLQVKNLKKYFPLRERGLLGSRGVVRAVDGINFYLLRGETLGLVGESGCGKSTTGRSILRLIQPTEGEIWFEGKNLVQLEKEELRSIRKEMQIIFQDPFASLNPRERIGSIIAEGLKVHRLVSGKEMKERVVEVLQKVGLNPEHTRCYPHEFSGGQKQRIGIARALVLNPKLVIADEPVSSLDVSIQAQIINLLKDLQNEFKLSYLMITHDLAVLENMSDRIAVMHLGKIVEMSSNDDLFSDPKHPYTQALLLAIPSPDPRVKKKRIILEGEIPSQINPPTGCKFHTRCFKRESQCSKEEPELREIAKNHLVACHLL